MKNNLLMIITQLFICTASLAMEREADPEKIGQEEKSCLASLYEKIQNSTISDYGEVPAAPKDYPLQHTSCAYACGKCDSWPTVCFDEYEPGLLLKAPFVAAGGTSVTLLSLSCLVTDKTLLTCGASLSPSIPCCVCMGAGCLIKQCAKALDKDRFVTDYEAGQRKGFKDSYFRKGVEATCNGFYEILKKISEPCLGESSVR